MMQSYKTICLGISHKTASVDLREDVACAPTALAQTLAVDPPLAASIREWAVLSTCNRFELYVRIAAGADEEIVIAWLQQTRPFDVVQLRPHFYVYKGEEVARHLLEVAAGLDSQVLGEPQILGQVASALNDAYEREGIGPHLNALFLAAIRAGKRARNQTGISRHPSSISSVAVSHIEAINGPVAEQKILVLGAGETAQLAVNSLRKRGAKQIAIANRTCQRARDLLAEEGGEVYRLDQLDEALLTADVVICATGAPHLILTQRLVAEAQEARNERPLMVVDIAVPRDVEPAVGALPGVRLINLDALHDRLEFARAAREQEVPHVKALVDEEMDAWRQTERELRVRPLIRDMRQKAELMRQRELARTLKYLGEVDPATRRHITHLSQALVNQLLHEPTRRLRVEAANGGSAELAAAVKILFDLAS